MKFFEWQKKINVESEHDDDCECDNCLTQYLKWRHDND